MSAYGHDEIDDEEAELDRIAARDRDDERASLGYQTAPAPTPSRAAGDAPVYCASRGCKGYKPGQMLLQKPGGGGAWDWCQECVSRANRATVERTREVIRNLKGAIVMGQAEEERRLLLELTSLIGAQANDTAKAIRDAASEKPAAGKRGRQ